MSAEHRINLIADEAPKFSRTDDAFERILNFARHFGESHITLALHAALPLSLTPELVHLIRFNFVPDAPPVAEADLLLSPLCRETGAEGYAMWPEVRELLLADLQQDRLFGLKRIKELAEFLLSYAARQFNDAATPVERDFLAAQQWSALAYLDPGAAAEQLAKALSAKLEEKNRSGSLRLAHLTQSLTAPLLAEGKMLRYAAGINKLSTGDGAGASDLFQTIGPLDQSPRIGSITLHSFGKAAQLWPQANATAPGQQTTKPAPAVTAKQTEPSISTPLYTLQVSVVNGDLRSASYPVAVGHYQGDSIAGAEKILDQALGGRLSQRLQAGLYPGAEGTADFIKADGNQPGGALVIGLGEIGELTGDKLRAGVTRVALRRALEFTNDPEKASRPTEHQRSAAFSSLLIGSHTGNGFSVSDSVTAIIQGALTANRMLFSQNLWEQVHIDKIEIIEMYEDTALQALHAVTSFAGSPPDQMAQGVKIEVVPQHLVSKPGGQYQRPLNTSIASQRLRLQINGVYQNTQGKSTGELLFRIFQGTESREDKLQATQRKLVDELIKEARDKFSYDEKLGTTLFELLLPNSVKEFVKQPDTDLLLIVDHDAAQYPWEMMALRDKGKARPLAIHSAMIRQFQTTPHPTINYALHPSALVVGDPLFESQKVAQLPGARHEAETVSQLISSDRRFTVTTSLGENAREVVKHLFASDYRIIHLAGKGIYDDKNPRQSGFLLGDDIFLTAAEFRQLRAIPELVFLNACYLGRIHKEPHSADAPKLATSLVEELIKMGVKAVIAPAWQIDDAAAVSFATEFYRGMLAGHTFGQAVLAARRKVYKEHPSTNTWGAYHCYGDSNFVLSLPSLRPQTPPSRSPLPTATVSTKQVTEKKSKSPKSSKAKPRRSASARAKSKIEKIVKKVQDFFETSDVDKTELKDKNNDHD